MSAWTTEAQVDLILGSMADHFDSTQKTDAIEFATGLLESQTTCEVAVDPETGLPLDQRFQTATAVLASQLLVASGVESVPVGVVAETIGGYSYRTEGGGIGSLLLVEDNPTIKSLIGWCLPQANYQLNTGGAIASLDECCGGCGNCAYSAHGYGCCCETPYRQTHYPYPEKAGQR